MSPYEITYQYNSDFTALRYGGNDTFNITNTIKYIEGDGCDVSQFSSITMGEIALIQYSTNCSLITIAMNAQNVCLIFLSTNFFY